MDLAFAFSCLIDIRTKTNSRECFGKLSAKTSQWPADDLNFRCVMLCRYEILFHSATETSAMRVRTRAVSSHETKPGFRACSNNCRSLFLFQTRESPPGTHTSCD